jgi:hypothetical protein
MNQPETVDDASFYKQGNLIATNPQDLSGCFPAACPERTNADKSGIFYSEFTG